MKKRFKTLITEDNPDFRQSLKRLLGAQFPFMDFEEATSAEEAITKASLFSPDLIFMDVRLPDGNGLKTAKTIKETVPDSAIFILTHYDSPEYREAARENGADHFILKGHSSGEEILLLVDSVVSGRPVSVENR